MAGVMFPPILHINNFRLLQVSLEFAMTSLEQVSSSPVSLYSFLIFSISHFCIVLLFENPLCQVCATLRRRGRGTRRWGACHTP